MQTSHSSMAGQITLQPCWPLTNGLEVLQWRCVAHCIAALEGADTGGAAIIEVRGDIAQATGGLRAQRNVLCQLRTAARPPALYQHRT